MASQDEAAPETIVVQWLGDAYVTMTLVSADDRPHMIRSAFPSTAVIAGGTSGIQVSWASLQPILDNLARRHPGFPRW